MSEPIPPSVEASPRAVFVILTNPVDVCTYVALKASGLPPGRVLGTGTLIDTARLRALLSRETGVNAADIRAYVLGEHGETQFPALSVASVGGERLNLENPAIQAPSRKRDGGHKVARLKGYTDYAVALGASRDLRGHRRRRPDHLARQHPRRRVQGRPGRLPQPPLRRRSERD